MTSLPFRGRAVRAGSRDGTRRALVATAVALAALGAGAAAPTLGESITDDSAAGVAAGFLLVLAAAAPLLLRLRRHGLDGPGLYALATVFFLGITALAWLGTPDRPGPGLDQAAIADALRLVALGLLAFGLGAWLVGPARAPRPTRLEPEDTPSRAVLAGLYGLSLAGVLLTFAVGAYGYVGTVEGEQRIASIGAFLSLVGTLGDLVLLVTALVYFRTHDRRTLWLLVGFVAVEMAVGFAGGNKRFTILPLIYVMVAYGLVYRRLPWRAIAAAAIFLLVVVVPTNARYREGVRSEQQSPSAALRQALTTPLELDPARAAEGASTFVFTRFRSIDSVALIRTQTPSPFPFAGGEKYVLLPAIVLVPRVAWPSKPVLDEAGQFTHTYGQRPREIRSATQITQVGDLYRNFGYAGPVAGLFLWGIVIAGLTALYIHRRSPRLEMVHIFILLTVVPYIDADLPNLIATATRAVPFAALVAWLLLPGRSGAPGYHRLLVGRHR